MPAESRLRAGLRVLSAVVFTAALALAMGAVWMALSLRLPGARIWFALPTGLVLGYCCRVWVSSHRPGAMLLAALGVLLAGIYMQCLFTGMKLAAVMGLGYLHTLQRAGVGMLLALSEASVDTHQLAALAAGVLLALWMAWRKPASRRRHAGDADAGDDAVRRRPAP